MAKDELHSECFSAGESNPARPRPRYLKSGNTNRCTSEEVIGSLLRNVGPCEAILTSLSR